MNNVTQIHDSAFQRLLETLRKMDTRSMTTPEVAEACEAAVPGVTIEQMVAALRIVGQEHYRAADRQRNK
jgi:hypothetical protein